MQNSGLAGTGSNVQIRGAGSLNASYGPVYYVDGIRFEAQPVSTGGVTNATVQYSSPLDFIDPEDIESIEVIKGPAASTLYGADAAGGVIQIITKKGTRGQQSVSWSARVEAGRNDLGSIELPTNYKLCDATKIAAPATWPGCAGVAAGTVLSMSPIQDDPHALRN